MRAVTNTSPLHYLILIQQADLLPILYEQVIIPRAVADELQHSSTPVHVRAWVEALPHGVRSGSRSRPRLEGRSVWVPGSATLSC
jgi:predicted nucleic acid-binding protein